MNAPVVVVTGGTKGIGLEIVRVFLDHGFKAVVCSRNLSTDIQELKGRYEDGAIEWFELDLSRKESVLDAGSKISKSFKAIDSLVNCAGVSHGSSFLMSRLEDFKAVFDVNFFHTLLFTQLISKKMIRRKRGSIVNIASTAGLLSDSGTVIYGASKAAIIHSTKVLANELGQYGIRVNAVAPAIVSTEMGKRNDEKYIALCEARSSLPGPIQPEDVADLVYFLSDSTVSSKITGQICRIDKGLN